MKTSKVPDKELSALWSNLTLDSETMRVVADDALTVVEPVAAPMPEPVVSATNAAALESGGALSGFEVSRTLGQGGMGVVRLARQTSLHRDVAIKTILPAARGAKATGDILREAWITGLLEHPNIIPVHSLGLDEFDAPMLVMKMVEGIVWSEALEDHEALPPRFRTEDLIESHLAILMQVCNAVHFAHSKGIIHRDLKPANVMLGAFGEVYLLDWGIAVSLLDDGTGRLPLAREISGVAGTAAYLAPEMAAANGAQINERTDVYLLGAILHEIITGKPRHEGKSVSATLLHAYESEPVDYDAHVPRELAAICNRATHKESSQRHATAEEFRLALVDYIQHRDSRRLAAESEARKLALGQEIQAFFDEHFGPLGRTASARIAEEAPAQIYTLFAECRFGFDQALRVWPDNQDARAGLKDALEVMADLELTLGNDRAAALIIGNITAPSPQLLARLTTLRANLKEEGRELAKLKRLRHAVDTTVGSRARAIMAFFLGLVLALIPLVTSYLVRKDIVTLSFPSYLLQFAAVAAGMSVVVFVMRRQVIRNATNKRIIISIFLALSGGFMMRILSYLAGLDVGTCVALENTVYAVSAMLVGVFTDRRLIPGGLAFLAGAIAMVLYPQWMLELDAASNAGALWAIALVWWMAPDS